MWLLFIQKINYIPVVNMVHSCMHKKEIFLKWNFCLGQFLHQYIWVLKSCLYSPFCHPTKLLINKIKTLIREAFIKYVINFLKFSCNIMYNHQTESTKSRIEAQLDDTTQHTKYHTESPTWMINNDWRILTTKNKTQITQTKGCSRIHSAGIYILFHSDVTSLVKSSSILKSSV